MFYKKWLFLFLILSFPVVVTAENACQVSPMDLSVNSLEEGIRPFYPPALKTVGDAVMYLLAGTPYKVAVGLPASNSAAAILARPIPPKARSQEAIPIYEALVRLIGDDARLVVDTKRQLITFEVMKGN